MAKERCFYSTCCVAYDPNHSTLDWTNGVVLFTSAKEVMFSPVSVCLFACIFVNWITQKLLIKSLRTFMEQFWRSID